MHNYSSSVKEKKRVRGTDILKTSFDNNQTKLLAWLSVHTHVSAVDLMIWETTVCCVGFCMWTNSSVCYCCDRCVSCGSTIKATHTWDALNSSSYQRSMFTLAPVTFTLRELLIKDEAMALKCEHLCLFHYCLLFLLFIATRASYTLWSMC